ncbi:hypothetical protein FACS1894201_02160 [Bacteroidia bacterium]|nr:hypothetical protein FACS1894201_02160 [Bacteroidia bacterium]
MIAISTRELVQGGDKYFKMALTQPVFLKRHNMLFRLQASDGNPSPSNDPFYADPLNVEQMKAAVVKSEQDVKDSNVKIFETAKSAIDYFDSFKV